MFEKFKTKIQGVLKWIKDTLAAGQKPSQQELEQKINNFRTELQEYVRDVNQVKRDYQTLINQYLKWYPPFPAKSGTLDDDIEKYLELIGHCIIIDPDTKDFLYKWGVDIYQNHSISAQRISEYVNAFTIARDDKSWCESHGFEYDLYRPYFDYLVTQLTPFLLPSQSKNTSAEGAVEAGGAEGVGGVRNR